MVEVLLKPFTKTNFQKYEMLYLNLLIQVGFTSSKRQL